MLRLQFRLLINKMERPLLIGISGGTASGKTSVAVKIGQELGLKSCTTISLDSFYLPLTAEYLASVQDYNFDHPNAFDFDLVLVTLEQLLRNETVEIPIYDFVTHSRMNYTQTVPPTQIIIF